MNYNDKYHHLKYMNDVQDIDYLLDEFEIDKDHIVNLLKTKPNEVTSSIWNDLLAQDNGCHSNLKNMEHDISCTHCQHMMQIVDLSNYNIGELFSVTIGKRLGDRMIIIDSEIGPTYLKWTSKNKLKGDNFTVKILVTWMVDDVFHRSDIPHGLNLVTSFICNHVGYSLYKMPTVKGELCTFDMLLDKKKVNDIIYGVLMQLIVIMNVLGNVAFSFGNAHINSFLFSDIPCNYEFKKNDVVCPYTMVLSDLAKSSVMVGNVLLFSESNKVSTIMNNNFNDVRYKSKGDKYVIEEYVFDTIFDKIKYQFPSIDFYLILLSMTAYPIFVNAIEKDDKCKKLWELVWGDNANTLKDGYDALREVELHKDPTNYVLSNL